MMLMLTAVLIFGAALSLPAWAGGTPELHQHLSKTTDAGASFYAGT